MLPSLKQILLLALSASLLACQMAGNITAPSRLQAANSLSDWLPFVQKSYQQTFFEHDTNQNQLIELNEVPYAAKTFAILDQNHDQHLSLQEALPGHQHMNSLSQSLKHFFKPNNPVNANENPMLDTLPQVSELQQAQHEMSQLAYRTNTGAQKIPVLLVPGYAEPSWYFMYGLYKDIKKAGYPVEGINLFPNFASAAEQAAKVKQRVEEIKQRLGVNKVNLVVHSFGGLISRYYIQNLGGTDSVKNLVTITTPHLGTYAAYAGPGSSANEMRPESDFLKTLNANGFAYEPVKYTSIWTNTDEIVLPPKNAIMPESTVHYVPWTGHLTVMFSKRTYGFVQAALKD